jgi:hypothetical protein
MSAALDSKISGYYPVAGYPRRNEIIWAERQSGLTMTAIAKKHGLSITRVNKIYCKQERRRREAGQTGAVNGAGP